MNAGAVMFTDCVFWFIIVPFLTIKDYNINLLIISMHTINAVFLLGDTALNCLRFPWFRIGYFCLWTVTYVIFQWIIHAIVKHWWPYPFLDLSPPYSPLCLCLLSQLCMFGDSLTEQSFRETGWGVALANDYNRKADVFVRGYGGYNTQWALFLLHHLFPLDSPKPPVATTIFFGPNDAALAGRTSERQHVPIEDFLSLHLLSNEIW